MGNLKGEAKKEPLLLSVNQLMERAVDLGDYKEVQRLAHIAKELSALEKREEEISQSRANLAALLKKPIKSEITHEKISTHERGNKVRSQYVEGVLTHQGIHLQRIATKKYHTTNDL